MLSDELTVRWKSECTILAWATKHGWAKISDNHGKNPHAHLLTFI